MLPKQFSTECNINDIENIQSTVWIYYNYKIHAKQHHYPPSWTLAKIDEFTLYKHNPALQCFLLAAQHIPPWLTSVVSTSVWLGACSEILHLKTHNSYSECPTFNPQSHIGAQLSVHKPLPVSELGFWEKQ